MKSKIHLRDYTEKDFDAVFALNQSELPHVSSITREELAHLAKESCNFRIAEVNGEIAGFLIGMAETADYQSINFQYFKSKYPRFFYIDRIVVGSNFRRIGVASTMYADVDRIAKEGAGLVTSEVNVKPPNEVSVNFHERMGFKEVGQQDTEGGKKRVSLLAKKLR